MKRVVAIIILGLIALGVQGGMAKVVPREICPDLGLLVVIAVGLHWQETTRGLIVASVLGFAADFLSSSVFGAHALLRVIAYALTTVGRSQMDLRGGLALGLFAGSLTLVYALALLSLMSLIEAPGHESAWTGFGGMFPQAVVNAIVAPLISGLVSRVSEWADGESSRPGLQIDAGRSRS